MNRDRCECEGKVVEALRARVWTTELQDHVAACVACEETRRVAESLLRYAATLQVANAVDSATGSVDAIWRQAQAERQAMILKRATRPLIVMRGLSVVCVLTFALWALRGFSRVDYRVWMHAWVGVRMETAVIGVAITVACIGVGALIMLREDRQRGVWNGAS